MSAQPTLSESIDRQAQQTRERARETVAGRGAEYGKAPTQPDADTTPIPHCRNCGADLVDVAASPERAREIARVAGDNQGHVAGCTNCITGRDSGRDIKTIVMAAQLARTRGEGLE
jgi:hypothetical protein